MRLFLLPISNRRVLIYCQRLNNQLSPEKTYLDKITSWADRKWLQWENHDSGWQKSVTRYGNKLFARIAYEEWSLKKIPPLTARRREEELVGKEAVQIMFPASMIKQESIIDHVQKLRTERQGLHRTRMWGTIAAMPLTAPFALIPIAPNLPFFYLVFRAWSHWKALSGSKHLAFLVDQNLIKTVPAPLLDVAYQICLVDAALSQAKLEIDRLGKAQAEYGERDPERDPRSNDKMVISEASGKLLAEALDVPELGAELERAVKQVWQSLNAQ